LKSLRKALDLIEIIGETGNIGIRELSARTGFPPATVHRIIATLVERGYLQQNQNNRNYSLSTRFLEFADSIQQRFDLIPIARPHLEQLSMNSGENVNLCVLDGPVVVYIDHVHSQKHVLRTFTRLGARVPLYATGVGKVYLSKMGADELDTYLDSVKLERYTGKTITDRNTMLKELRMIKKQGYAVDDQEKESGVRCVAAPIFDYNGSMAAAISISGAAQWITRERIKPLARMVMDCAERISTELGYKYDKINK
jgi:IclR family KDG regulon transcriptional repressor